MSALKETEINVSQLLILNHFIFPLYSVFLWLMLVAISLQNMASKLL